MYIWFFIWVYNSIIRRLGELLFLVRKDDDGITESQATRYEAKAYTTNEGKPE